MSELVYYVAASEDGCIAGPNDALDWLPAPGANGEDHGCAAFLATIDAIVMGRATWRVMRGFGEPWPYGDRPGWVLTRRLLEADAPLSVQTTTFELATLRAQWAERGIQRVWLVGGGDVAGQFAAAGAIDELILTTVPVRLGAGVPLFGARGAARDAWRDVAPLKRWPDGLSQRVMRRAPPSARGSATTAAPS